MMFMTMPHSELTRMPMPTVFERSLAEDTSANITYPIGPLGWILSKMHYIYTTDYAQAKLENEVVYERLQNDNVVSVANGNIRTRTKAAIPHLADWLPVGMARNPMRKSTIVLANIVELNIARRPNLLTV